MKKILLLAVALLAVPSGAESTDGASFLQNLTGSAPTLVTDGISLAGALGYRVSLSAGSGQTLSGAGSLLCYFYTEVSVSAGVVTQRWARCPTNLDITAIPSGARDVALGDFVNAVGGGRILYVPSGVTVSSGTTVTVTIYVRRK